MFSLIVDYRILDDIIYKTTDPVRDITSSCLGDGSPGSTTSIQSSLIKQEIPFSSLQVLGDSATPGFRVQQTTSHISFIFDTAGVVPGTASIFFDREIDSGGFTQVCDSSLPSQKQMDGQFETSNQGVVKMWKFSLHLSRGVNQDYKHFITGTNNSLLVVLKKAEDALWLGSCIRNQSSS